MLSSEDKYKLYRPKKFLGQNFLVDNNISRKIVSSIEAGENDIVIEIGPGQGALTKHFIKSCLHFIAVEIDASVVLMLKEKYGQSLNLQNFLVNEDFLKFDLGKVFEMFTDSVKAGAAERKLKIIGNIPYNITSEILFKIIDSDAEIDSAVIMVQKEVAARITAKPGTKQYGILAVQIQAFADVRALFDVPPTAFFPKPDVYSTVIKLVINKYKYQINDRENFRSVVRTAFGKRRKTLRNSLKELMNEKNIDEKDIPLDFTRRPETLTVGEFVLIANKIK